MSNNEPDKQGARARRASLLWPPFREKLARVLSRLEEDQYLILADRRSDRFVQFMAQGAAGMRIETTSNAYLHRAERLEEREIDALIAAGWQAPTGTPQSATPENDPQGSPNYFKDIAAPVPYEVIAELAVHTLTEILRVPYPGFLVYQAFDRDGKAIELSELGLKRAQPRGQPGNAPDPAQLLLGALREISGVRDLEFDKDGDVAIRCGTVAVFVRMVPGSPYLRIFTPLLLAVEETPELLARLNEINLGAANLRVFAQGGAIVAVTDLPTFPLMREHLELALRDFCQVTDGIDELLQAEFGGRTYFLQTIPSSTLIH